MIEEFKMYVQKFDFNDKNIERKYHHSIRVMALCKLIATDLNLDDNDVELAEIIGLLHDYGRFEQWAKYHTFKDSLSIDHGDYGDYLLFNQNEIIHYWSKKEDYDEIYDAVKYHNKFSVPSHLSTRNELFCKIVRDADKLDILYLYLSKILEFPESGDVSFRVKEDFDRNKLINKSDEVSKADHGVALLAFVYDLNFLYSFRYLKKYKIIEQIYSLVKNKEQFHYYFEKAIQYIDNKCK